MEERVLREKQNTAGLSPVTWPHDREEKQEAIGWICYYVYPLFILILTSSL